MFCKHFFSWSSITLCLVVTRAGSLHFLPSFPAFSESASLTFYLLVNGRRKSPAPPSGHASHAAAAMRPRMPSIWDNKPFRNVCLYGDALHVISQWSNLLSVLVCKGVSNRGEPPSHGPHSRNEVVYEGGREGSSFLVEHVDERKGVQLKLWLEIARLWSLFHQQDGWMIKSDIFNLLEPGL